MPAPRFLVGLAVVLVVAVAAFYLWARQPELPPLDTAHPPSFDAATVAKGAQLAAIGDCVVCHTAAGGPPYAGGRPISTPFGTIYSTNISPHAEAGIGLWSEDAFRRSLRRGVARRGNYLYPAFPYVHFAKLSDDDVHALYAYLMTRAPQDSRPPPTWLRFPLNLRWLLAAWNLLYLDSSPYQPDPRQSPEWNRGAYLVEGLGHCGECHTPRTLLGAEKTGHPLSGGVAEGWTAPALDSGSPAPVPWDADHITRYLQDGWDPQHGVAAGPMAPVTQQLGGADPHDIRAMAGYLAAMQGKPSVERQSRAEALLSQASRNAVADATGKRVRDLPLTPGRLKAAMGI